MLGRIEILLIGAAIAATIETLLGKSTTIRLHLTQAETLRAALEWLGKTSFKAILLNLDLPDSKGLKTFQVLQRKCPQIPILILSDEWNQRLALKAMDQGAQNYLVTAGIKRSAFLRSIACAIHRHKYRLKLYSQQLLATLALDRLVCGVILIGSTGKILRMNQCAKEIIAAKDCLVLENGRIHSDIKEQDRPLQNLISSILRAGRVATSVRGGQLKICRKNKAPLSVLVTPINLYAHLPGGSKRGAAIFISDSERIKLTIEETLRNDYGLTNAEARLCCLILQGMSVAECSRNLTITVNTVRDHLKKIFIKTGTTRQTDLVRLLLTQPVATET
jgi:DNA-binding NarL/FixJ family response regulator